MNTQYEKRSISLACANYRLRRKEKKLKNEIAVFFTVLGLLCAGLYAIISSIPY